MKLLRVFSTALICWNTIGILVLLSKFIRIGQDSISNQGIGSVTNIQGGVPPETDHTSSPTSKIVRSRHFEKRRFQEEHLNVPDIYLKDSMRRVRVKKVSDPWFPRLQDIKFNNIYWQTFDADGATFHVYSAYYDNREQVSYGRVWIRVIAMVDTVPPPSVKCAVWFNSGHRVFVSATVTMEHMWRQAWGAVRNGTLQPYLISCLVSKRGTAHSPMDNIPDMVSLMNLTQRRPNTNLKVRYDSVSDGTVNVTENKKEFAVCVKGLEFPSVDLSLRLLEWIHLVRLLGADQIYFYELDVHPNVARVLDWMQENGLANVTPMTLPGSQPNMPQLRNLYLRNMIGTKRLNEIVPYNDCLYRNIYRYDYVLLLDIDEIIMPLSSDSWRGLMQQIRSTIALNKGKSYRPASYNVRNVYFFDDLEHEGEEMEAIPEYLHMCRHVIRSSNYSKRGRYVKCFHNTSCVRALHNHYPFSCLNRCRPCTSFDISPYMAQLQHYRRDCHDMNVTECERHFKSDTVLDTSIWRFKDKLDENISKDIKELQIGN